MIFSLLGMGYNPHQPGQYYPPQQGGYTAGGGNEHSDRSNGKVGHFKFERYSTQICIRAQCIRAQRIRAQRIRAQFTCTHMHMRNLYSRVNQSTNIKNSKPRI